MRQVTNMILKPIMVIVFLTGCLTLNGCGRFEDATELLERISKLEQALESSNKIIQEHQQKEVEYLKKISELQAANQQLKEKHRNNIDKLF
jgi:hypothetical protein